MPPLNIAFLGLGNMGRGMAARLLGAGHAVTVHNRTRSRADELVGQGTLWADTPREAASGADAIFAMVADDPASRALWLGPDGALAGDMAPNAFAVECSTLSHDWVMELAGVAQSKGLRYIDSPVTGLPDAAARGELTLLLGAETTDLEAARPFLDVLSKEIIHFGGVGAGTAYKLMINLIGSVQLASLAEGMAVAEKAGLDMAQVVEAIIKGQAASPQVVRNARAMAENSHEPVIFSTSLRLKDTLYGLALAEKFAIDPATGQAAANQLNRAVEDGMATANESRLFDTLRKP